MTIKNFILDQKVHFTASTWMLQGVQPYLRPMGVQAIKTYQVGNEQHAYIVYPCLFTSTPTVWNFLLTAALYWIRDEIYDTMLWSKC